MARPTTAALLGIILSLYALHVENVQHAREEAEDMGEELLGEYRSLCDIEALGASCSATFALPEGRMLSYFGLVKEGSPLDVPNALLGVLFYSYVLFSDNVGAALRPPGGLTLFAASLAMSSSVFLAYKLMVLRKLCLLCLTTHVINLVLINHYVRAFFRGTTTKKKGGAKTN
jgi:hypothetical protein